MAHALVTLPDPEQQYRNLLQQHAEVALELLLNGLRDGTIPAVRALHLIESQAAGSRSLIGEVAATPELRPREGTPYTSAADVNAEAIAFMREMGALFREQHATRPRPRRASPTIEVMPAEFEGNPGLPSAEAP